MKIALHGEGTISHLDPSAALSSAERQVLPQIFEMLVKQTFNGNIEPELALSYKVQKNKIIFNLGRRLFHNKKIIKAEDIKQSLINAFKNSHQTSCNEWRGGQIFLCEEDMILKNNQLHLAIRDYTAIDVLRELSQISFAILSPENTPAQPIGSGPYQLKSFSKKLVTLTPFLDHPSFKQSFEKLVYIGLSSLEKRKKAFLAGKLDEFTHWGRAETIGLTAKMKLSHSPSWFVNLIQFHQNSRLFKKTNYKKHFYDVANKCLHSFPKYHNWIPATGLVPPSFYGHKKSRAPYSKNITPLPNKQTLRIAVSHQRQANELLSAFSNDELSHYGWKIQPVILSSHTLKQTYSSRKDIDATVVSLHFSNKNSLDIVNIFSDKHKINFSHHNNFQLNKMIEQMSGATEDESIFLFHEIEDLLISHQICLPIGYIPIHRVHNTQYEAELLDSNSIYSFRYLRATKSELKLKLQEQSQVIQSLECQITELIAESQLIQNVEQVAHDIKSPLGALETLLGFLQTIPSEQLLLYKNSLTQIKNLAEKVSLASFKKVDLADFKSFVIKEPSLGERTVFSNQEQRTNVGSVLKEVLQESSLLYENPLFFSNDCLQGDFVFANNFELKRILSNLIKNSVHSYSSNLEGSIYLQLLQHSDRLSIAIQDFGHGIDPKKLQHVFEKRFTTKENSSGLGLFHAKKHLDAWGGKIHILSTKDAGTTVTLELRKANPNLKFKNKLA